MLNFKFTSSIIIEGKRWCRARRNWANMRVEIANIEYGVDASILFWQVNAICNPRNNATDRKKSNPTWNELTR